MSMPVCRFTLGSKQLTDPKETAGRLFQDICGKEYQLWRSMFGSAKIGRMSVQNLMEEWLVVESKDDIMRPLNEPLQIFSD
jgi:hypothetical protein